MHVIRFGHPSDIPSHVIYSVADDLHSFTSDKVTSMRRAREFVLQKTNSTGSTVGCVFLCVRANFIAVNAVALCIGGDRQMMYYVRTLLNAMDVIETFEHSKKRFQAIKDAFEFVSREM